MVPLPRVGPWCRRRRHQARPHPRLTPRIRNAFCRTPTRCAKTGPQRWISSVPKPRAWQQLDPSIPAIMWNQEQKAANSAVAPVMNSFANKLESLGRRSNNLTLADFAALSAQYRRAFAQSDLDLRPGRQPPGQRRDLHLHHGPGGLRGSGQLIPGKPRPTAVFPTANAPWGRPPSLLRWLRTGWSAVRSGRR